MFSATRYRAVPSASKPAQKSKHISRVATERGRVLFPLLVVALCLWFLLQAVRQNLLDESVATIQKVVQVNVNQYAAHDLNTVPTVKVNPKNTNEVDVHIDLAQLVKEITQARLKKMGILAGQAEPKPNKPAESKGDSGSAKVGSGHGATLSPTISILPARKDLFLQVTAVGRLGNQLFLWASGSGIAHKNRAQLCMENLQLSKTFVGPFAGRCPGVRFGNTIAEQGFGRFQEVSFSSNSAVRPYSYLQSFKYFQGLHLKDKLRFLPAIERQASDYILAQKLVGKTLVGIHLRRGDLIEAGWSYMRFPPGQYFVNAMRYYREKYPQAHFLVASSNTSWATSQAMFRAPDVTIVTAKHSAAVDLAILSSCSHMIISVGTFGWWAGFLAGGQVIYYANEYVMEHRIVHNKLKPEEFYPPSWIRMSSETAPALPQPNVPGSQLIVKRGDPVMAKGSWDGSPIVLEQFKLLFFTIPKNSCEEFKRLFRRMRGLSDWRTRYNHPAVGGQPATTLPHDPARNGLKYLYDYTPERATEIVNDPSWTKAIFIRDPLTRFLSAYLDKIVNHPYHNRHLKLTFEEFIGKVEKGFKDPHWNPQCELIDCKKWLPKLNFIGRIDTTAQDAKKLLKRVKAWDKFGATGWEDGGAIFQGKPDSEHATQAKGKLARYYTPALEKRVRSLLQVDYEQLPLSQ